MLWAIKPCKAVNPFTTPSCSRAGPGVRCQTSSQPCRPGINAIHAPCICSVERFSSSFKANAAVEEELYIFSRHILPCQWLQHERWQLSKPSHLSNLNKTRTTAMLEWNVAPVPMDLTLLSRVRTMLVKSQPSSIPRPQVTDFDKRNQIFAQSITPGLRLFLRNIFRINTTRFQGLLAPRSFCWDQEFIKV